LRVRSRIQSTISSWAASPAAMRSTMPASISTSGARHVRAVGVEEVCREQERGALVGVGERRVVGEVCEQDGRLLGQRWVGLDVAEWRERRVQGGLGQCELWESDDGLAVDGE
jgi:hypothetical protein